MSRDRLAAMRNAGARADEYAHYDTDQLSESHSIPSYRTDPSEGRRHPAGGFSLAGSNQPPYTSHPHVYEDEKAYYEYDEPPRRGAGRKPPPDPFDEQPPMEMKAVSSAVKSRPDQGPREVSTTEEFFDAIGNLQVDLKELQHLISIVQDLSKRSLDSKSDEERADLQAESESLTLDIRSLSGQMKQFIQGFEADHSLLRQRGDPEGNLAVRTDQLAAVKKRFLEAVQRYAEVEQAARKAMRTRVERQVRIVRPDASEAEVRAAVDDEINGSGGVFQQALVSSNRMGNARNALREVQSRAADIKRIEDTISELAALFNDMATMVEEQDVQVQHIEKHAVEVNQDVEAATSELKTAVASAQGARRKRKCCFVIILVILLLIGAGIAVYILYKNGTLAHIGGPSPSAARNTTSSR